MRPKAQSNVRAFIRTCCLNSYSQTSPATHDVKDDICVLTGPRTGMGRVGAARVCSPFSPSCRVLVAFVLTNHLFVHTHPRPANAKGARRKDNHCVLTCSLNDWRTHRPQEKWGCPIKFVLLLIPLDLQVTYSNQLQSTGKLPDSHSLSASHQF